MKKLLLLLFLCFAESAVARSNFVEFEFQHSRRIPNNKVEIKIQEEAGQKYTMLVRISPMPGKIATGDAATEFQQTISKETFEKLLQALSELNFSFMHPKFETTGMDGTDWVLRFGNFQNNSRIEIWSPDYQTEERGLKGFVSVCDQIFELAGPEIKKIIRN